MAFTCKFVPVVAGVFLGLIAFVSGDAALINDVCGKTANPGSCHNCFNMYTRSSNEDVKALGRTSIDCASSQSLNLISAVGDALANAKNEVKNAYIDCSTKLQSGDQQIASALQSWQSAHYADAGNKMLAALQFARDCGTDVQRFNPPPSVGNGLSALEGLCDAANGVLNQI
ncbi:pectinesterase inhibitor-like [Corylus avellana]|uniref:pectinesterase inhibitor-like n=1 Tax=Corylus avellana TaxID=13451 RepID=UPI00286ABB60|nr:pectinesterase inhibitor-like [Corylus avellana]